jgi:ABC-type nitrate/sulfonate/bicarbonate transport system permease component
MTAYLPSSFDVNGVRAVVFVLAIASVVLSWALLALERNLLKWR